MRIDYVHIPANTKRWPYVGLMLGQRRRRWANIKPTLGQPLVFAGMAHVDTWGIVTLSYQSGNLIKNIDRFAEPYSNYIVAHSLNVCV